MRKSKSALVLVHSYYLRDTRARRHGSALAAHGWQVDVVCARDATEVFKETHGEVRVWRLPARRRGGSASRRIFEYVTFAAMAFLAVVFLWLRRRHRLVYVLGMPNFLVFASFLPRLFGANVLLDMRDPFPEFFLAKYEKTPTHPIYKALLIEERISARFASAVLAAVPSMADLYVRSVPRERISVVWNSVDPQLFVERPPRPDPDDRTLLYVGTVTYPYAVDLAVRAVARLRHRVPGLRLRVVGDGDLVPRLTEIAREEGIAEKVEIIPPVPLEDVPAILKTAWLGVQPVRPSPLMQHSLSTKILEWCTVGLPVAVGRTPPLTHLFSEQDILFHEPGDLDGLCTRIIEAHADPEELSRRAKRARVAAEAISFGKQIDAFTQVAEKP
jgi:glycosyltransferase involved in cell wall biosynthesis